MNVYFDNAATTPLDKNVFEAMVPYMLEYYGNPSSAHTYGRKTRHAVESSRSTIAELLNVSPEEIFFTSGGTEADNTAILSAIRGIGIKHAITSRLEHHAVLNTLKALEKSGDITLDFIKNDDQGNINLSHLEQLLLHYNQSFVSIMHGNNEIGNLNDIASIGDLCKKYNAVFHTDTVQTMGHYKLDLSELQADFLVGSAHKFHGPKGVGFLYVRKTIAASPLIFGGSQERCVRAGTENVAGIVGLGKAMDIAYSEIDNHRRYIKNLKRCCIERLTLKFPSIVFNGNSGIIEKSMYTVLSTGFPSGKEHLLSRLDTRGIAASGGSACNSNHNASHVLTALNADLTKQVIRFSFSKYNSIEEIDFLIDELVDAYRELSIA